MTSDLVPGVSMHQCASGLRLLYRATEAKSTATIARNAEMGDTRKSACTRACTNFSINSDSLTLELSIQNQTTQHLVHTRTHARTHTHTGQGVAMSLLCSRWLDHAGATAVKLTVRGTDCSSRQWVCRYRTWEVPLLTLSNIFILSYLVMAVRHMYIGMQHVKQLPYTSFR